MDLAAVNSVLQEVGRACGFPGLALDDQGDASLIVDGGVEVFLHYMEASQSLIVESMLGEGLGDASEAMLVRLSSANRLGIETVGGTLALGPNDEIMLMRALAPASISRAAVERALRWQAAAVASLHEHLFGTDLTPQAARDASATVEPGQGRPPMDPRMFA